MELFQLSGRTALVTGGTRGIGLALAKGFKKAGARVWIHGSKEESTREIAAEHGFLWVSGNLKDSRSLMPMIDKIADGEECLDILVNNAGSENHSQIAKADEDFLDDIYNINAKSAFLFVRHLLPLLQKSPHASIINVTSIHQTVPMKTASSYCMSKASLAMFSKVAALEFAELGIRVNNLAPGAIETDINREVIKNMPFDQWIPMGRVGRPEELIGPAIFLASDASSYMTGATIFVDGGYKENLLRY